MIIRPKTAIMTSTPTRYEFLIKGRPEPNRVPDTQHNRASSGQNIREGTSRSHESDKPTKSAIKIDIDKVNAQKFRSVIVSMNDSFLINTCRGRLIVQINNMITAATKINPTTISLSTLFETIYH